MKHRCDACGSQSTSISMDGALLCRICSATVRAEMDRRRAAGESVGGLAIAREIYKRDNSIDGYTLRDIPSNLWQRAKHRAVDEEVSLRDLIFTSLEEHLQTPLKK